MISQTAFSFAADDVPADTITAHGETLYISEWAKRLDMSEDTLRKRLAANWDPVEAVTAPKQVTNRPRSLRDAVPAGAPGSRSWYDLPFEDDTWAQAFVKAHPDGASMEQVGAAMGVEVSWVCEIEQGAIKKLIEKLMQVADYNFESLNGQLGFLGGRDNAASVDIGAHTLVELLIGHLLGSDDEDDDEEEWEGEVIDDRTVALLPRSGSKEDEGDEADRWLAAHGGGQ